MLQDRLGLETTSIPVFGGPPGLSTPHQSMV